MKIDYIKNFLVSACSVLAVSAITILFTDHIDTRANTSFRDKSEVSLTRMQDDINIIKQNDARIQAQLDMLLKQTR